MATDLYRIKVLEKGGCTVRLRVIITYYDMQDTPAATAQGFFLWVLWDNSFQYGQAANAPLGDAISVRDITSWEFRRDQEARFITQVLRLDSHNFPVSDNPVYQDDEDDEDDEDADYEEPVPDYDQYAYTDYLVTVTDERWLAHLTPGKSWGTVAYEGR